MTRHDHHRDHCPYCGHAHAPAELCHISRRRFLFLTGLTFAATAVDPTALIQPVELLHYQGQRFVFAGHGVITFADVNEILKKYYIPQIREQLLERDLPFYQRIRHGRG